MKILLARDQILYINILTEIKMKLIQMGSGQAILDMLYMEGVIDSDTNIDNLYVMTMELMLILTINF